MLDTVKSIIKELPDQTFGEFYMDYICEIQDQNICTEINTVRTDEIISIEKLITKLRSAL